MQDRGYEQAARFYDLFDQKENIAFFAHYAGQVDVILDIGAGTGRIAMPLAERGNRLVCIEPSPAMRALFRAKLVDWPELAGRIRLLAGDAASFKRPERFPAAFLSGSFDHLLDDDERLAALRNIARHLVTGGVLVFDLFLGLMRSAPLAPVGCVEQGDREIRQLVGTQLLPDGRSEVTLVYEVWRQSELVERVEQKSWAGMIDRPNVHRLLARAGYEVRREFANYQFDPYQGDDPLLIVEAVRL